ncbi:competence type IV pilus minor pilin ComGF [Fredinandcohnia quinoae]|uniref:Prepilin-type N-terminal cleavage/methylation domain-containing protein n=1 Tax=Fredinandcohnia quinoae TaxID=2918902 RepID=A0AAW5DXV9_9BACI|nr:competence type IV pilus minor pilin ComGF [Fredinandcohnia sp. SECRCQ15]MCH1624913.1 prepilin-type N-terminal cleavage/methylation domain-containing protein [Fredinandcohnia sp. SECRCQ15]
MKSDKGFTFIEMLLTFSVLLVILSFISPFLHVISKNTNVQFNKLEWEVFIQQVKMEIRETNEVKINKNNHSVTFTNHGGQTILYEKYGDKIRRRVDGAGHELLLQKINSVTFHSKNNTIIISVMSNDGDRFETNISSFKQIEVNYVE